MNVIKCENGHFFDGDKFSACPQCGAKQKLESLSSSADEKTPVKTSFFRKKEKRNGIFPIPLKNLDIRLHHIKKQQDYNNK